MATAVGGVAVATSPDFSSWVAPHLPVMCRVAARLAPSADRDDIVQEALSRAWRKRSSYDATRGTPSAWLCAIVAGEARRWRQTSSRRGPVQDLTAAPTTTERDIDLERAVAALPRRQREAVDLFYFVGLGVADVAQVMGCAEGTVKSTLSDARRRLRAVLGEVD